MRSAARSLRHRARRGGCGGVSFRCDRERSLSRRRPGNGIAPHDGGPGVLRGVTAGRHAAGGCIGRPPDEPSDKKARAASRQESTAIRSRSSDARWDALAAAGMSPLAVAASAADSQKAAQESSPFAAFAQAASSRSVSGANRAITAQTAAGPLASDNGSASRWIVHTNIFNKSWPCPAAQRRVASG